jgi:hypothetical protein
MRIELWDFAGAAGAGVTRGSLQPPSGASSRLNGSRATLVARILERRFGTPPGLATGSSPGLPLTLPLTLPAMLSLMLPRGPIIDPRLPVPGAGGARFWRREAE